MREEAAVAAAAEVAAAGGDVNAVAAAAVAAAAAAEAREGFGRSGPRSRRRQQQQQQQQPRPSQPPRQPGKLRVKGSNGGGGGRGDNDDDSDDADVEDSGATAVSADGQRLRLSTNDFKTPVRRPVPGNFTASASGSASAAALSPAPAPVRSAEGQDAVGGCRLCAPSGGGKISGGLMPKLEAAAGVKACGCKPAERFAQTDEMDCHPRETGARSPGPLGESLLVGGRGGDEAKDEEREVRPFAWHRSVGKNYFVFWVIMGWTHLPSSKHGCGSRTYYPPCSL